MADFHNRIAKLCLNHFNSLPKTGKPNHKEWTILSCIVLENSGQLQIVALGTGTKCIGYDKLSPKGDILNDSHAEIMCRRAFLKYVYESMLSPQSNENILKFNETTRKFTLIDTKKFHFFTTHVPCGDAAISPKNGSQDEDFGIPIQDFKLSKRTFDSDTDIGTPNKRLKISQDIYRTGAKCLESDSRQDPKLEGPNYHVLGAVRTKPGRGVRTLSVSCSDKLTKWVYLGIQGALLGFLLEEPVYLNSFTIIGTTQFNQESLQRALYNRVKDLILIPPFKRANLLVGQADFTFDFEKSSDKNPCPSSIYWTKVLGNKKQMEIAVEGRKQGATKAQLKDPKSGLEICKLKLFQNFISVIKKYNISLENVEIDSLTYAKAKSLSSSYQIAWNSLKNSLGVWPQNDLNLLNFQITY